MLYPPEKHNHKLGHNVFFLFFPFKKKKNKLLCHTMTPHKHRESTNPIHKPYQKIEKIELFKTLVEQTSLYKAPNVNLKL